MDEILDIIDAEMDRAFYYTNTLPQSFRRKSTPDNLLVREHSKGYLNIRVYEVREGVNNTTFILLFSNQQENLFHTHGMWLLEATEEIPGLERVIPFCLDDLEGHVPMETCKPYPVRDIRSVKLTDLGEALARELISYRSAHWF